ncbi:hypothetical protein GCM10007978_13290 [Shewanella hanedai]|jgi:hypothetical protein|uniref:Lipoprotein n=1 Tax=Shewanella hanedai TaxID=25 RepID=A0A553JQE2_SHEHA|nr:hypothetical protein [Shewanella hanedai]TRY14694.1 hypothetical protein FN961_08310 [Shewanella hanedai]GGI76973.1 hypothetical protein GCM10007978_13290 [Shewanella hanedai]
MKLKIISTLSMLFVLTACSTTGYVVAPDKETASLRIISTESGNTPVWIDKTEGCINHDFLPGGEIAVLGAKANLMADRQAGRRIGMPLYRSDVHEKQQTELEVEAGVPISFYFAGVWVDGTNTRIDGYTYCVKEVDFTPISGANYEAEYFVDNIDGKEQCTIKLFDIVSENGNFIKKENQNYKLTTEPCK